MILVSAPRLHLLTKLRFPSFVWHTLGSALQAKRSAGFLGGFLGGDAQGGAWTVTTWGSEADMRAFRNSGAHKTAMPKLLKLCDEASFTHWLAESPGVPTALGWVLHFGTFSSLSAASPISSSLFPQVAHPPASFRGTSVLLFFCDALPFYGYVFAIGFFVAPELDFSWINSYPSGKSVSPWRPNLKHFVN